jgi:hypothetical protein
MKLNFKKITQFFQSKTFMVVVSFVGLFLVSVGASVLIFSLTSGKVGKANNSSTAKSKIDPNLPKTEICPINGEKFTKQERDIWESRRPILAVIENHLDSRPQSGLSRSDIVYEAVAEGGITRFLAVFYCGVAADNYKIGQIRSARVYFINYASEYGTNPLFVHWGGANNICDNCPGGIKPVGDINSKVDAYRLLEKIGWLNGQWGNDMNGATNTGYPALLTDDRRMDLAVEHQKIGQTDEIYKEAIKRGFEFKDSKGVVWNKNYTAYKFVDGKVESPTVTNISFNFWDSMAGYDVEWKYDAGNNNYLRFNGGKSHTDMENGEQLSAKSIAVIFVKEEGPVDKELHMFYTTVGNGKALIFQNGQVIEGTWNKASATSQTKFMGQDGKEISFVRGRLWIEILPIGNTVKY